MIFEKISREEKLEEFTASYREKGIADRIEAVLFVSACPDVQRVTDCLCGAFPNAAVFGINSIILSEGRVDQEGISVVMFEGEQQYFDYAFGLIERVRTEPTGSIIDIQKKVESVNAGVEDTICLEFCTGGEEYLVTTLNSVMREYGIEVFGSTVWNSDEVNGKSVISYGGRLYEDACMYLLLHNKVGRIKTYIQNIYCPHEDGKGHIVTKVDKATKSLIELDYRPAADVYCEDMNISRDEIMDRFAYHPLGKIVGDITYTVSMRSVGEDGRINLYKQVEKNDLLQIMDLGDYRKIINDQFEKIRNENPNISTVITVDCLHRYNLFQMEDYLDEYVNELASKFGRTIGLIGAGEQCSDQVLNQTMICVVFEHDENRVSKAPFPVEKKKFPEKGTIDERIYPLSYLIKYVSETKDDIINKETSVMQYLLEMYNLIGKELDENDPEILKAFLKTLQDSSRAMFDHISRMNLNFSNISNMLDQAEYLVGDVVFRDGLTGLLNRYFYNVNGNAAFREASEKYGLSIAFFDIDDFKRYNTEYGHDLGDKILQRIAEELMYYFRNDPKVYLIRMGGGEFMIMNAGQIRYNAFIRRVDEVRKIIADSEVHYEGKIVKFSISIGLAHSETDSLKELLEMYRRADERLYMAKNAGKNQCCSASTWNLL